MQIHSLSFRIKLDTADPRPTGTTPEQAAQIWSAITARQLSTLKVLRLEFRQEAGSEYYIVEAMGNEIIE